MTFMRINEERLIMYRSSYPENFCKKCVITKFTKLIRKHLCRNDFFHKDARLHPVYSGTDFFKNTFLTEHLRATASKSNITLNLFSLIEL